MSNHQRIPLADLLSALDATLPGSCGLVLVHAPVHDSCGLVHTVVLADDEMAPFQPIECLLNEADATQSFRELGRRGPVRWGGRDADGMRHWFGVWTLKGTPFRLWHRYGIALVINDGALRGRVIGTDISCSDVVDIDVQRNWLGDYRVVLRTRSGAFDLLRAGADADDGCPLGLIDLASRVRFAVSSEVARLPVRGGPYRDGR